MIFDTVDVRECEGCLLAHSLQTSGGRVVKGTLLTGSMALEFARSGISQVLVAQPEAGDSHEDDAALVIARQLCGSGAGHQRSCQESCSTAEASISGRVTLWHT